MEDLAVLIKRAFFMGFKKYAEEIGIQEPAKLMNTTSQPQVESADAPEINILRRGWPDPAKRAKKLHEKMIDKNKAGIDDVKDKTRMTKESPEVTVG